MRDLFFTPTAEAQFNDWAETDKKIKIKIIQLLEDTLRDHLKELVNQNH